MNFMVLAPDSKHGEERSLKGANTLSTTTPSSLNHLSPSDFSHFQDDKRSFFSLQKLLFIAAFGELAVKTLRIFDKLGRRFRVCSFDVQIPIPVKWTPCGWCFRFSLTLQEKNVKKFSSKLQH